MTGDTQHILTKAREEVQIVANSLDNDHPQAADLAYLADELERIEDEMGED